MPVAHRQGGSLSSVVPQRAPRSSKRDLLLYLSGFWSRKKKNRGKRSTPEEADEWLRNFLRGMQTKGKLQQKNDFKRPSSSGAARSLSVATKSSPHAAIKNPEVTKPLVAPKESIPVYTSPKYSALARKSLTHRLSLMELCRPRKFPYEPPEKIVAQGSSGLGAYAERIIGYLKAGSKISPKEHSYIQLLAGILDREITEVGSQLRDAAAFSHVMRGGSIPARSTGNARPGAALPEAKRLAWQVLPAGKWGFSQIRSHFLRMRRDWKNLEWDLTRLDFAKKLRPMESWIGKDEFDGYVIFVFPWTRAALLDHPIKGNACYILRRNWKELSHLSKFELLQKHKKTALRVTHIGNWQKRIKRALRRDSR